MRRHGVSEAMLELPAASPEFISLLTEEVAWAEACFDRGQSLVKTAPIVLRPAIRLFLEGGRGVANAIRHTGFDTLAKRPTLAKSTKLRLAGQAAISMMISRISRCFWGSLS